MSQISNIPEKEYVYDYSQTPFIDTVMGKSVFLPQLYRKATMKERFDFDGVSAYICDDCGSLLPIRVPYFLITCFRCGNQWIFGLYLRKYISSYSPFRKFMRWLKYQFGGVKQ